MFKLLLLYYVFCTISAHKILYYSPRFSRSHVNFVGSIADTLIQAGHNVTILMPECSTKIATTGTKLAKVIHTPASPEAIAVFGEKKNFAEMVWKSEFGLRSMLQQSRSMELAFVKTCQKVNEQKKLLEELKREKFDLVMTELFDACAFGLVEVLKVPAHVITCASTLMDPIASFVGVPLIPSYVPSIFSTFMEDMSYFQRLLNFISTEIAKFFFGRILVAESKLYKEIYGKDFPDLEDIVGQSSFVLTNGEPLLDFPRPITHKIVDIGGLSIPAVKPLNEEWERILSKRNRAVLISFGSNADSSAMPKAMKDVFLKTFAQFPDITFIWKYEADDLPLEKYPNLVIDKWLPQNDILGHRNLVAFLTHGGMNSIVETISKGKPMIVVPLFADQPRNGNLVKRAGVGFRLLKDDLTKPGVLHDAFSKILSDMSFTENAQRLAKMIKKKPVDPKKLLIKHVEFAAEFGRLPQLDPIGRKMPFYKYYLLDIFIPAFFILLFVSILSLYITYRLLARLFRRLGKDKKD